MESDQEIRAQISCMNKKDLGYYHPANHSVKFLLPLHCSFHSEVLNISKLEVTLKDGVLIPATPEFGAYHFYQKLEMLNIANMKKEQMLDLIASSNTYINQDWNEYMELKTGLWKTQSKYIEDLMRIEETGQALAKLKFKQVELMEIETENNNLWTWLSHGLTKIVDTLGETGTVICGFIFFGFLTLAVAGCAWKCWTSKSSSPAAHSPGLTSSCSCSTC